MFGGIRAVLFDAVGTLIFADPPVAAAYRSLGGQFGSSLSEDEIRRRFGRAFAGQEQEDVEVHGQRTSDLRERDRWQRIVAEVLDDVADQQRLFAALWDHFADPRHWRLYEDAARWLPQAAARGLVWGIASNFDTRLDAIVAAKPELAGARRPLFLSTRLGWRKPHPEFFRSIEGELRLSPSELLFVGDHPDHDAGAARTAGWRAVLVSREGELPDGAIRDFSDLIFEC